MRRIAFAIVTLLLFFAASALAQTHSVTMSWTLSVDDTPAKCPAGTCSQKVYRGVGAPTCTVTTPAIATLSETVTSYTDTTPTAGQNLCYAVTFLNGAGESIFSNSVTALIPNPPPPPPTGLTVTSIALNLSNGKDTVTATLRDKPGMLWWAVFDQFGHTLDRGIKNSATGVFIIASKPFTPPARNQLTFSACESMGGKCVYRQIVPTS